MLGRGMILSGTNTLLYAKLLDIGDGLIVEPATLATVRADRSLGGGDI
jgi:hypothetical protein